LGDLGDVRAVEPLIACLKDEARAVRGQAAWSLGKLGHARAVTSSSSKISSSSAAIIVTGPDECCVGFPKRFTASGGTPPYTWTSSDPEIATVDELTGEVTGVIKGRGGKVTIRATDSFGNAPEQ
jgi:uncharacterized protein YjdB